MCGRFSLTLSGDALAGHFDVEPPQPFGPRYNIAPSQPVLAIREKNIRGEREVVHLKWGLVPSWSKDPTIGNRMINARAETLAEKPSFRSAFRHRRCLVPADGFYEWQQENIKGRQKQPWLVRRQDSGPFAFAGLWETWMDSNGTELYTCTLITTEANAGMQPIHHRMPVILEPEEYPVWLTRETVPQAELTALLAERPWPWMESLPVSTYVNAPANEGPQCHEAAPPPPGQLV